MKRIALQQYTKQKKLYEENDQQILDKFVEYMRMCSDPLNIIKYMEEKSICIYLGNYWLFKAELLADMGDFKNAAICLREAMSRKNIINENQIHEDENLKAINKKMILSMKRRPPKGKKSAFQYDTISEDEKVTLESFQKAAEIYDQNYTQASRQCQRIFALKMQGKQISWLAPIQQRKSEKMQQIEEKIKSVGNFDNFYSMRTPISKKDPMKLTKTMDSIQMLKKKKSTKGKTKQRQNSDSDSEENSCSLMMHSTPVGHQFSLKRRVTFKSGDIRIEKIRGEIQSQNSPEKNPQDEYKQHSSNLIKRSSILKNKTPEMGQKDSE